MFPLLWKQVLRAFWEKCASHHGNRPSYSLPLAWHEINCCLALQVSEGGDNSGHPLCPASASLSSHRWPVVWHTVRISRPQGQARCTRLKSLPAPQNGLSSAAEGSCQQHVGSGGGEIKGMLESSHQTLPLQQCSASGGVCWDCRPPEEQESENHQLWEEHTAHLSSAGRVQSHLQGKVTQAALPDPFQASLLWREVLFPSPTIFSKQVSLLH